MDIQAEAGESLDEFCKRMITHALTGNDVHGTYNGVTVYLNGNMHNGNVLKLLQVTLGSLIHTTAMLHERKQK